MDEMSLNIGFGLAGLMGLHQCIFPDDHLRMFFLAASPTVKKLCEEDSNGAFRVATEVMRWLGFANLSMCVLGRLVCRDTPPSASLLADVIGGLCIFDVLFVKRVWVLEAQDIVNPNMSKGVGGALALVGSSLLAYGLIS